MSEAAPESPGISPAGVTAPGDPAWLTIRRRGEAVTVRGLFWQACWQPDETVLLCPCHEMRLLAIALAVCLAAGTAAGVVLDISQLALLAGAGALWMTWSALHHRMLRVGDNYVDLREWVLGIPFRRRILGGSVEVRRRTDTPGRWACVELLRRGRRWTVDSMLPHEEAEWLARSIARAAGWPVRGVECGCRPHHS